MALTPPESAEGFAEYIAVNKPYLIEIEDEIQTCIRGASEAKLKLEVHIRGGNVVLVDFWNARRWKKS